MILSLIAAASENNVIGKDGTLPWNLPKDMEYFRAKTRGHPVIMGRRTWESIGGVPLPGRTNIVITSQGTPIPDAIVVHSLEEGIDRAAEENPIEAFVIGGEGVFREALPRADRMYLTRVHAKVEGDTYFPIFDENEWTVVSEERHEKDEENEYAYTFYVLTAFSS